MLRLDGPPLPGFQLGCAQRNSLMDAYLDRIAPEKLTVLCASGFFLDDRRLTFVNEYGAEFSIEEIEENSLRWLKRRIGDAPSRRLGRNDLTLLR
jgi:hypothetical protein